MNSTSGQSLHNQISRMPEHTRRHFTLDMELVDLHQSLSDIDIEYTPIITERITKREMTAFKIRAYLPLKSIFLKLTGYFHLDMSRQRPYFEIVYLLYYLSLNEPLADLLSSHGRRHPFKGDCSSKDDVESCFCLEEIEERQLKVLLSLVFSLLSYAWYFGSCCTAVILRASGNTQLKIEPMCTRNRISEHSRRTKVVIFL